MKYRIAVVDPAWKFSDALPGKKRGAEKHYTCLSIDDLKKLEMPEFEDNAIMFLWRVASMQEEAIDLMRAYGFKTKSEIVWVKEKIKPQPIHGPQDLAFGMGRITRGSHEVCLVGTRGKVSSLIKDHAVRSVFFAPRRKHSQKPKEFYDLVERLTGGVGPYVDIFAREKHREGWDFIGNEVGIELKIKS